MLRSTRTPRKYLLLPSHPTPNGRLHLGHIAGPYLKMDVLRRADDAVLIFPIDSFESYVLLRANQLGIEPSAVVERYSQEIQLDLKALDIGVDLFFDPLQDRFFQGYRKSIFDRIDSLQDRSAIEERVESFLYCPASSRFIVGCWLLGSCPSCGRESGGYSCENCGCHYRPEELVGPRSRLDEGDLITISCKTKFLKIRELPALLSRIEDMLPLAFQEIMRRHFARSGATMRISVPGSWGIPITVDGETYPQVVYSGFASLGLLDACGREYADRYKSGHPFHRGSDVTTVCSFGIDNTVSRVISCIGAALEDEIFRPPDALLLNHFYLLEGSKFSTSRDHAIWASNIGSLSPTMPDLVRFYLLDTSPETSVTEFSISQFLARANEFFTAWNPVLERGLSNVLSAPAQPAPELLLQALEEYLAVQERCLDLTMFRSSGLPDVIRHWIDVGHKLAEEAPYWWLKGLALLAFPVLPRLSSALWSYLGHDDQPAESSFLQLRPVRDNSIQLFQQVSERDLQSCLPISLRES